jgi:hypothetical protein
MAASSGTAYQLFQLIGWDQRMPEGTARLEQTTINRPADCDLRDATHLRGLFNFVRDAWQRFVRSVPVTDRYQCFH